MAVDYLALNLLELFVGSCIGAISSFNRFALEDCDPKGVAADFDKGMAWLNSLFKDLYTLPRRELLDALDATHGMEIVEYSGAVDTCYTCIVLQMMTKMYVVMNVDSFSPDGGLQSFLSSSKSLPYSNTNNMRYQALTELMGRAFSRIPVNSIEPLQAELVSAHWQLIASDLRQSPIFIDDVEKLLALIKQEFRAVRQAAEAENHKPNGVQATPTLREQTSLMETSQAALKSRDAGEATVEAESTREGGSKLDIDPTTMSQAERNIIEVIREADRYLTQLQIVAALEAKHGAASLGTTKNNLAGLRRRKVLTNFQDKDKRGYGLPEWE